MADSNIGGLPLAPNVADDSLLVMEQQGTAMRLTGAMLKEYAKQGVEMEFQEDLSQSQAAADRAQSAASSIEDMTVEAETLDNGQPATVSKGLKNGKVNLTFGLPRGEQGVPGQTGADGPRGPQGPPGNGLTILGHYDTEAELRAAVAAPEPGEAYSVGTVRPYDTYIFDGVSLDWRNYGPIFGGGSVLPDNLVTCEGGATIVLEGDFGEAPHIIPISNKEPPPLTAEDVQYKDGETVKGAIDKLFTSGSEGKALIASAVTAKGVETAADDSFQTMHDNILAIQDGADTSDATANPGDILGGKTAYTASGKVEGIIPSLPAQTITPGTADKTIANGLYLAGTQTVRGDPNLVSSNIRKGASIFGVPGAVESSFAAVLTVKADIGAVVTATCGDASVEALSTTGTVVMELPIEGTWKVTAVRGMAQYNTVTLEVSNHYSAELTAALHVQWLMKAEPLSRARALLAAASIGETAIFYGGNNAGSANMATDFYNSSLVHSTQTDQAGSINHAAAANDNYAVFAGGYRNYYTVVAFDRSLTKKTDVARLDTGRFDLAGVRVGKYVLFGGGQYQNTTSGAYTYYDTVDAYDAELTHRAATPLAGTLQYPAAASNENYAIFAGKSDAASAYNSSLTRSITAGLSVKRDQLAAARAGSYILFAGGNLMDTVDAYDLFLTRTTPESLSAARYQLAATTLKDFAVFGSGRTMSSGSKNSGAVDVYDPYLVRTTPRETTPVYDAAAVSVGSYALFGGGTAPPSMDTVDVYHYT